ncbi:hypothetical protein EB001_19165, partial [bacterium]|nr:hypothetical protein [bacterium]
MTNINISSIQIDSVDATRQPGSLDVAFPGGGTRYVVSSEKTDTKTISIPTINSNFELGDFENNFLKKFYQTAIGDSQDVFTPQKIKIVEVNTNKNFAPQVNSPKPSSLPLIYNDEILHDFGKDLKNPNGSDKVPEYPFRVNFTQMISKGLMCHTSLASEGEDVLVKHYLCNKDHVMWKSASGKDERCYYNLGLKYALEYNYTLTGTIKTYQYNKDSDDAEIGSSTYKLNRSGLVTTRQIYKVSAPKEGGAWKNQNLKSGGLWYGKFDEKNGFLVLNTRIDLNKDDANNSRLSGVPDGVRVKFTKFNNTIVKSESKDLYIHSADTPGVYFLTSKRTFNSDGSMTLGDKITGTTSKLLTYVNTYIAKLKTLNDKIL